MPVIEDPALDVAIDASLDGLLRALVLEPTGDDRFAVPPETVSMFDRIYGGQLLAQALLGAGATVEGKAAQSLHAAFVRAGMPGEPIEVVVTRVRDGRTMATRQVSVVQGGQALLVGIASFHTNGDEPSVAAAVPEVAGPADTPRLQQWVQGDTGRHWIDRPPPVDLRLPVAPRFLGGPASTEARSHWMRLPRPVGADPLLHAALLAYASDFFLMDMIFRVHPDDLGPGTANALSVDHAIWFHRQPRFDDWHLHTQEALALVGARGLARGSIHHHDGQLVATAVQEVLLR